MRDKHDLEAHIHISKTTSQAYHEVHRDRCIIIFTVQGYTNIRVWGTEKLRTGVQRLTYNEQKAIVFVLSTTFVKLTSPSEEIKQGSSTSIGAATKTITRIVVEVDRDTADVPFSLVICCDVTFWPILNRFANSNSRSELRNPNQDLLISCPDLLWRFSSLGSFCHL
ncbi:hypothetical protein LguiB_027640 [Lonicera macranthoides]